MATSGTIMQKVNPEIFSAANKTGSVEKLVEAENFLKDKCSKLNDIGSS